MEHHFEGGKSITVVSQDVIDGKREVYVQRGDGLDGWCVFADPCRQEPSPETMTEDDGVELGLLEGEIVSLLTNGNIASYWASQRIKSVLGLFESHYDKREARRRLTEWAGELEDADGNKRPIAPSTLSKMLLTADLPDIVSVHELSVAERYRLKRALDKGVASFEDTLDDLYHLSRPDFEAKYLGKVPAMEKPRHECPICRKVHTYYDDDMRMHDRRDERESMDYDITEWRDEYVG